MNGDYFFEVMGTKVNNKVDRMVQTQNSLEPLTAAEWSQITSFAKQVENNLGFMVRGYTRRSEERGMMFDVEIITRPLTKNV